MPRFVLASAVVLGTLIAFVGDAAANYQRTFTPDIQFMRQNKDPGNCGVVAVAPFAATKGALSATATFTVATSRSPRTETRTATAPAFDDTIKYVETFTAPAGVHWVKLGSNAIDGPFPNDCSDSERRLRAALSKTATVVVTIAGDAPACTVAKKARKAALAAVSARSKALARANGTSAKRRAAKQLAAAKTKAAAAKRKQDSACAPS
jgi:hypothetical protein